MEKETANTIIAIILLILFVIVGINYFKNLSAALDYAPNCAWSNDPITCAEVVRSGGK